MRRAKKIVDQMWADVAQLPESEQKAAAQFIIKTRSRDRLNAMIDLATSEPGVPLLPDDLDKNIWLLTCQNGTLDLCTGELREHRPDDLLTKLCPTPYDAGATSELWDRFLLLTFKADNELIEFVQRLHGYCLTGSVREDVFPVYWGKGSNGKSTLIGAFAAALGPDYAASAAPDLLIKHGRDRHPTELADLHGRRFVSCVETGNGADLNENLVKSLSGGDTIKARRCREDFWEFRPTHKVILCTNHKPEIDGTDNALWRRLRLVPFSQKFWNPDDGVQGEPNLKINKQMRDLLRTPEVSTAILAWAVRGCLAWRRDALGMPKTVSDASKEYRNDSDVIGQFIAEQCVTDDAAKARVSDLRDAFDRWAKENELPMQSWRKVGKELGKRGFEKFTSDGTCYRGIGLKSTAV